MYYYFLRGHDYENGLLSNDVLIVVAVVVVVVELVLAAVLVVVGKIHTGREEKNDYCYYY